MKQVRYLTAVGLVDLPPHLRGDKDAIRDLGDQLAAGFVKAGLAEYVDPQQLEEEHEAELEEKKAELKRPYANANRSDWEEWAVANGADPEEAKGMKKNELMAKYGERL